MATEYDIQIKQGATYTLDVQVDRSAGVPWDLTTPGTTMAAKIRATFDAAAAIDEFTIAVVDGPNGALRISLTAAETAALVGPGGVERLNRLGFWDLEFTEGTTVTRVLQGRVSLSQEATK